MSEQTIVATILGIGFWLLVIAWALRRILRPGAAPAPLRVEYDSAADSAYLYFTSESLEPVRDSIPCDLPDGMQGFVVLDWKDGRLVGLEVLDASKLLRDDFLASAGG